MNEIVFKELSMQFGGSRRHFKTLHNILFPNTNISSDWIEWYIDNVATGVRVYGAWSNETELIGMWCLETKSLKMGNNTVSQVGRCFAVGIHPDFRRKNLFVELSKFAIEEEKKKGLLEYVIGFPQQGRSVVDAHLKAGWELVQKIDAFSCTVETRPKEVSLKYFDISYFFSDKRSDADSKLIYFTPEGSFLQSSAYKNKRWFGSPDNFYICLRHDTSAIILKPYAGHCHVVDIFSNYNDFNCVTNLLNAAKLLAFNHKWSELNIWCAENELYKRAIVDAGFKNGAKFGHPIDMLAVKINANEKLEFSSTHFQMGVEEIY